jgi:hypothetical protein
MTATKLGRLLKEKGGMENKLNGHDVLKKGTKPGNTWEPSNQATQEPLNRTSKEHHR